MSIRDLIVLGIVGLTIPYAFRLPFVGLLTFSWLAYMRAQDLCWGFARTARLSYVVAAAMIVGWLFHESSRRRFTRWDLRTRIMLALVVVTTIGLLGARDQRVYVQDRFIEFVKIILIALFTAGQVTSRKRLKLMLWTIAVSLGFFGFKGGIYGILSGGSPIIRGPGGMLLDNNDFALALVMNIPLLWYLGSMEQAKWIRTGTRVAVGLTVFTILLTHSRGAFLSLAAVGLVFWLRSQRKGLGVLAVCAGVLIFFVLIPDHVRDRLASIGDYEQDASAMGRIMAWRVAGAMIIDHPIIGVGIRNFRQHFTDYIDFEITWAPEAHNSYLQIWAEGGTVSFVLYMALLVSCFVTLRKLRLLAFRTEGGAWMFHYARMLEAAMVAFIVGAMFLNRGHFDLVYHIIAIITAFNFVALHWASQPVGEREGDAEDDMFAPIRLGVPEHPKRPRPVFAAPQVRRHGWGR